MSHHDYDNDYDHYDDGLHFFDDDDEEDKLHKIVVTNLWIMFIGLAVCFFLVLLIWLLTP